MEARYDIIIPHVLQTNRHKDFPTTDMPVYKLSPRAIVFLTKSIRERVLAPFAVRVNLDPDDLYFKDLFVVFYEASKGQRELAIHQDGSLFSFNIGLTNEFVGGGTYFPNGIGNVRVNAGSCVLHDGKMSHGGAAISQVRRSLFKVSLLKYLFKGFSLDHCWVCQYNTERSK